MRRVLASCTSALLITAAPLAQSHHHDLSGRWRLVEPTTDALAMETLVITAAGELLITQTPIAITIEHPSQPGTHPEAGVFRYGMGGVVGGVPGGVSHESNWGVSHIGTQLMISRSTKGAYDDRGIRITHAHGSMWRLDGPTRLVIEFSEERTGERPKIAARVYVKVMPQ